MTKHGWLTTRQAEDLFLEPDEFDDEDALAAYLDEIAPRIGWVIIYFNSLEDLITHFARDCVLRDPFQDERMDVFLAGMMYAAKCRAVMDLYGQVLDFTSGVITYDDLRAVSDRLEECGARRNEYAHAQWIGVKAGGMVRVKSMSRRPGGIGHRYKKFDVAKIEEDIDFISETRGIVEDFHERMFERMNGRSDATPSAAPSC